MFEPEPKGIGELMNRIIETSFRPGRTFALPADFDERNSGGLKGTKTRARTTLKARPFDPWLEDKATMLTLPPVDPVTRMRGKSRFGREFYLRVISNYYSVDPGSIGRMVTWEASNDHVTKAATLRAKVAGFPAMKTLDEFTLPHRPGIRKNKLAKLASGPYLTDADNVIFLRPTGTGPYSSRSRSVLSLAFTAMVCCLTRPPDGSAVSNTFTKQEPSIKNSQGLPDTD